MTRATRLPPVSLEDKYLADSGSALMSGLQALVRLTLDQRRLDSARGLDTAAYVSGYQGSPLGGLDREFERARRHLEETGVVFRPGLNEELAATAVAGTQLIGELEKRRHAGIVGYWFGKNPGLDRAADAIRHGNVSGTAPLGGALALVGDDPGCKSSTIPSSCEPMCRGLVMPVLAPGTVRQILELGMHGVAMSRESGLWTALKIVADIADASATVEFDGLYADVPVPGSRLHKPPVLLPPTSVEAERDQLGKRLSRVLDYARQAELNRIVFEPRQPRFSLVAAGLAHQAVLRGLADLGIGEPEMESIGLRVAQVGMPWPLDPEFVAELAAGVEAVLVFEDKLPFLESQIKEALYDFPKRPRVEGTAGGEGAFRPASGTVLAADAARALVAWLPDAKLPASAGEGQAGDGRATLLPLAPAPPSRIPYFCSGCPHNRSTKASDDTLVGIGIGCHIMIALDDGGRGHLLGMPQMGGEGAQWLGLAPFTDDDHFVQNIGDGTFHHSGSLAFRAAVAAHAKITYKLLYNDAVAMTGGQNPVGRIEIPELTRLLAAEGVKAIEITTPEPEGYCGVKLDPIARVCHRDDLAEVEARLAATDGVTVLIHDDRCAAEERRLRKRGKLLTPNRRVWINGRVCEGCGDCGEKSTCLSVQPVETEFGRKTRIHQASCNQDLSCLDGDCPAFVVVEGGSAKPAEAPRAPTDLPEPENLLVGGDFLLRMPGIGGTGVVTVSQILQMAAHLDGLHAAGLEQTGLAQKGGPVTSDVRIGRDPIAGSLRASERAADVLIGFDLLGAAAAANLEVADPERTIAVVNTTRVPTAPMVTHTSERFPAEQSLRRRIEARTRADRNVYLDAEAISVGLLGDHMPANLLLLGAAFQNGCLPVSAPAVERAIELNGAAVEPNLEAFRWGRAAVADPGLLPPTGAPEADLSPRTSAELVAKRTADLEEFQNRRYAAAFAASVAAIGGRIEAALGAGGEELTLDYARGLYKLMAYKDEYEVARLHLDSAERVRREGEFGPGAKVGIMLHPPVLRAMGMKRKLRVGRWGLPFLGALSKGRVLRGRPYDPFGHTQVRKTERELIDEYKALVATTVEHLTPETAALFADLVRLPDMVRGYEEIKLANVERFRVRAAELKSEMCV